MGSNKGLQKWKEDGGVEETESQGGMTREGPSDALLERLKP